MFRVKIVSVIYNSNNKNTIAITNYYYLVHYLLKYNLTTMFSTMDSRMHVMALYVLLEDKITKRRETCNFFSFSIAIQVWQQMVSKG